MKNLLNVTHRRADIARQYAVRIVLFSVYAFI